MNLQTTLVRQSFQGLFRLLVSNRTVRNKILKMIDDKSYEALVVRNPDNRLRRVMEDRHDYLVALLHGFGRAIERGLISKHVQNRLLDSFVSNVILSSEQEEAASTLGFNPPFFVLVSPTGKCNLRCVGCYAASDPGNHASLDFETFDRILQEKQELWGSHFTVISGGEPFLWRDGARGLLDMVAKHPSDAFLVYTNGTMITDDVARRMGELGNISPAVSVEGFEKETDARRGKGVHRRILTTFGRLRDHGVPFGISATPTRDNWDVVTSDHFVDFYFDQEGAVYGWLFQYMPIGRGQSLELMVTPEQRVEMWRRMQRLVRERKVCLADFWNSGTASCGCISAGRSGGYFYIDWNGNVAPCVFVPYATENIHRIYAEGGNLNTALDSPLFKSIRAWQDRYGYAEPAENTQNWLCPCVTRDHFEVLKEAISLSGADPINEHAAAALSDEAYCQGMVCYGKDIGRLTDPIWVEEYEGAPAQALAGSMSS